MKVLIILASFNGEKYIKEQLESLLSQINVNVKVIVFDDCSKDNTKHIVNSFRNDSRVEFLINTPPTRSAAGNFFGAIKFLDEIVIKNYDFIAFSDQDDIWFANKLDEAIKLIKKDNAALYMSNLILWDEKTMLKTVLTKNFPQKQFDYLFEGGSAGCTYVFTNELCLSFKQSLVNVNYVNWKFFSHDWFVYFFARINNFRVSIDSNAYILYRIHNDNVHGQLNTNSVFAIKERLRMVSEGWYFEHIKGFSQIIPPNSKQKQIHELYSKNYLTRLFVLLRYNFILMRSSKKFIQFFIVSLLPLKIKK